LNEINGYKKDRAVYHFWFVFHYGELETLPIFKQKGGKGENITGN
jgi:hypothetical protein